MVMKRVVRPPQRLERGNSQHQTPIGSKFRYKKTQCLDVIFDMLQHIEQENGIERFIEIGERRWTSAEVQVDCLARLLSCPRECIGIHFHGTYVAEGT